MSVDTCLLIGTLHMAGYCDLDFFFSLSENLKSHIKIGCVCSKRMIQNKMQ